MPQLSRRRLLLAKSESTYGTSSSPAGTDATLVTGLEVEPLQLELKDRELVYPYLGNSPQVVTRRSVSVKFSVELAGSGTAGTAPRWSPLMKACGFSETIVASTSVTYAPVSTSFSSATLDFRNDGIKHLIVGARGTVGLDLQTGEIPKLNFEFMGLYGTPTDANFPSANYSLQSPPLAVNSQNTTTVSVFGYSGCLQQLTLDASNEMVFRQLAGCTQQVLITNRKPSGEVTIELPTIAAKDFFSLAEAQTSGAVNVTHGTTAGNIVAVNIGQATFGAPSLVDGDGIQHVKLPLRPIPTSAGNDEFSIVLT